MVILKCSSIYVHTTTVITYTSLIMKYVGTKFIWDPHPLIYTIDIIYSVPRTFDSRREPRVCLGFNGRYT